MSDFPNTDLQIISDVDMPRLLDLSEKTWETMKKRGNRPQVTQLSERRIGYRQDHIRQWLDSKRRTDTFQQIGDAAQRVVDGLKK